MAGSAVPLNYGATGPIPSSQHLDPPGAPVSKSRSCGALNFAPPGSAYPHLTVNSHKDSKSTESSPPPPYTAVASHPVKQAPQSRAAPPMETTITPWQPGPGERTQYEGPDMPSADLPESHMGTEPVPLPPEVGRLPKIRGYEGTSHHASGSGPPIPPPPYNGSKENTKRPEEQYSSVSQISADQARKALLKEVGKHCCYGKGAVSGMEITNVSPSNAMHYKLETFTESRGVSWEQEPFRGQAIDKASDGSAPPPWSVHCQPTTMFNNEVHAMEVPHTAVVMPCHGCSSMGWLRCHNCQGRGYKRCLSCNGSGRDWKVDAHGHRHVESCWQCHGTGRKRCLSCSNDGRIVCKTCQGFRQVKCYIKLTVTFKNHTAEHVVEKSDVPVNLVKGVTGILVFEQSLPRVWPIAHYPDQEVCSGSQKLVDEHNNKYKNARILMQRQKLRSVPVSECSYKWKSTEDHFWVYGKEEAVYAPNYPQKCCWGCTIL